MNRVVEIIRNGLVESFHDGNVAVVQQNGALTHFFGDPEQICYFRSSGKPFIMLSHLMKKIHEVFGFTLKEVAIMASSHSGGKQHIETLMSIANKLKVKESDINCGVREPYGGSEKIELYASGDLPSQWHNNCSGKHLGFIAACKIMGWPLDNYWDISHPIQQDILACIAEFSDTPKESIHIGIDGCGVPVFGVPLAKMALAYARLFNTNCFNGKYKEAQELLYRAVAEFPEMIAGNDRLDTDLIRLSKGDLFGKMGADGVFCVHCHPQGLGIAVKIKDGGVRAVDPVVIETLSQLDILRKEMLEKMNHYHYPPVQTWTGKTIGLIKPAFQLIKA
ncbi:MAG: asparaginase [Ruminiclostridium sp.]|nr:asparaginase [Ruminiclostridium sp.]